MKWFNFRKAMSLIDKALEKRPSYGEAQYWKGNLLYTLYNYDEALVYLAKVSPRNANYAVARYLSAEIHRVQGRMKDALKEARKASRVEDGAVFGKAVEARVALAQGDFAKAASALADAVASPKAAPTLMALAAVALRRAGRAAEAASAARAALAVDPLEFLALNELALASGASRRDEIMRAQVESYLELASYYEDAGLFDDAAAVLEHYRGEVARAACSQRARPLPPRLVQRKARSRRRGRRAPRRRVRRESRHGFRVPPRGRHGPRSRPRA